MTNKIKPKVTIESIQGKDYTVVWYDGGYSGTMSWINHCNGTLQGRGLGRYHISATALPALPRNPKRKDAELLYEYRAKGLHAVADACEWMTFDYMMRRLNQERPWIFEITHATYEGERIEIALEG